MPLRVCPPPLSDPFTLQPQESVLFSGISNELELMAQRKLMAEQGNYNLDGVRPPSPLFNQQGLAHGILLRPSPQLPALHDIASLPHLISATGSVAMVCLLLVLVGIAHVSGRRCGCVVLQANGSRFCDGVMYPTAVPSHSWVTLLCGGALHRPHPKPSRGREARGSSGPDAVVMKRRSEGSGMWRHRQDGMERADRRG